MVDAEPEPKLVTDFLSKTQVKYPLLPNSEKRKAEKLYLKVKQVEAAEARAVYGKDDTDFLVELVFKRTDCWELIRIEDSSL